MNKPEKKEVCDKNYCLSNQSYNQAIDEYEKFLPNETELIALILIELELPKKSDRSRIVSKDEMIECAKTIAKRIGK